MRRMAATALPSEDLTAVQWCSRCRVLCLRGCVHQEGGMGSGPPPAASASHAVKHDQSYIPYLPAMACAFRSSVLHKPATNTVSLSTAVQARPAEYASMRTAPPPPHPHLVPGQGRVVQGPVAGVVDRRVHVPVRVRGGGVMRRGEGDGGDRGAVGGGDRGTGPQQILCRPREPCLYPHSSPIPPAPSIVCPSLPPLVAACSRTHHSRTGRFTVSSIQCRCAS